MIPDQPDEIIPLFPGRIQNQTRPMLEIIENLRWDYKSRYKTPPLFLILGGNKLKQTFQELYERNVIAKNGMMVVEIMGMALVRVKHDCVEVGE